MVSAVRRLPLTVRRGLLVVWDCLSWVVALLGFVAVRYDFALTNPQWTWALIYVGIAIVLLVTVGMITKLYRGRSRVGSFDEATIMAFTVVGIALPLGIAVPLLASDFPRGIGLLLPPMALVLMWAGRWLFRFVILNQGQATTLSTVPALVYGAGDAGHEVARLVDTAIDAPYSIVGFLDDDPHKRNLRVRKYRVLGSGDDLVEQARKREAEVVILAISNAAPSFIQSVADRCQLHGIDFVVIPPVREMISGRIELSQLREFNVTDLLGRRPIRTDLSKITDYVTGKVVLVTGAGGSIGSELARQVYRLGPSKLVLVDRDESELHALQLSLYGTGLLDSDDFVLCDIRDYPALREVFQAQHPQVVFHAAALKHLPMLERFPLEGWKTNVLGTLNVLRCAAEVGVERFVNISTDKAADASSALGRSKRIAERLTSWWGNRLDLPWVSVRFGNVLGSRGSVLYTFAAQIEQGGPVTVTHPDVTRYFMTIPEACQLVLQAGAIGEPGDAMVLDMGEPVRIVEVAERLIAESGKNIEIRYTGLRKGEKMHEVLFADRELGTPSEHPLISRVPVRGLDPNELPGDSVTKADVLPLLDQDLESEPRRAADEEDSE